MSPIRTVKQHQNIAFMYLIVFRVLFKVQHFNTAQLMFYVYVCLMHFNLLLPQ